MQITKTGDNKFQVKSKDISIILDEKGVAVDDYLFNNPGEFERRGIFIEGVVPNGDGTVFLIHVEDISLCFTGKLSHLLSSDAVKSFGDVDILFVPMGLDGTISEEEAEKTISTVDPKVVVPTYFDFDSDLKKVLGMEPELIDNYRIKKAEIPTEDRKLVVFSK